jgi:hypothetical protein
MANVAACKAVSSEFDSQREIHGGCRQAALTSVLKTGDTERYGDRHCPPSSNSWKVNWPSGQHGLLNHWCLYRHTDQDRSFPPFFVGSGTGWILVFAVNERKQGSIPWLLTINATVV